MLQVRQVQKWQLAQKEKSAGFKSPDLGSLLIHLLTTTTDFDINYFFNFFLQPKLIFIGMRVMRPSRKEISSMLFTFTQKELE